MDWDSYTFKNESFDRYIRYYASIWSLDGEELTLVEELSMHKCTETDQELLFKNLDYIDLDEMNREWGKFHCLDTPEKVQLRQGP